LEAGEQRIFHGSFEIEVFESEGPLNNLIKMAPVLFCRVTGAIETSIVIISYDSQQKRWNEFRREVSYDHSQEIIARLKRLGIPERLPEVTGVHQTAPFRIQLSLKITFDDRRFYLDLSAAEGIEGKDAGKLRELFQYLFKLADFPGGSILIYKNPFWQEADPEIEEPICDVTEIPLELTRPTLYLARVEDDQLLKEAEFYLAIKAEVPETKVIEGLPQLAKICDYEVIDRVVSCALPGVFINHVNIPPAEISPRPGFQFFKLDTKNPYWEGIKKSKLIAVRVPDEFPELQLAMYAVQSQ